MRTIKLLHIHIIAAALLLILVLAGCSPSGSPGAENAAVEIGDSHAVSIDQEVENKSSNLIINDIPIMNEDYIQETSDQLSSILLNSEIFQFTFKMPDVSNIYPEFSSEGGKITVTWSDQGKVLLKVNMTEGSKTALINDSNKPVSMESAPKTVDGRLYIPVEPFIEALKMKETYDKALDLTFIQYAENFQADMMQGTWSDTKTDLFTALNNALSGAGELPSFGVGYQFNKDGTYRYMIIGADGFGDTLLQHQGKYKIIGSTIIYYDIAETLYEGSPLELTYKDTKRVAPFFDFIGGFKSDSNEIQIGDYWLNKVNP